VREISAEVGISYDTLQAILTEDLNMRCISAKFVPRVVEGIIVGDYTWVYRYDTETKGQSSQWKSPESPRPKTARQVRSKVKVMLIFFYTEGIVHHELVPEDQTVNQHCCVEIPKRLRLAVCRKRPKKRESRAWALYRDNAPSHRAHSIQIFFSTTRHSCGSATTLLSDMAPCDFLLFPKLKMALKGKRFDIDTIKGNTTKHLSSIPKDSFEKCSQQWHNR
jgi:hypothetical protein